MCELVSVRANVAPSIKEKALSALSEMGLSLSDYLRLAMIHVGEERNIPFALRCPNRAGEASGVNIADGA
jgi:DNA-damage-inducible protein J